MKVSREQMAANRRKILEAAARFFLEHGFESVSVAKIMHAAGLTHGGFYGHFKSKDDLIAQTLAYSLDASLLANLDLADLTTNYLTTKHRDDRAGGCVVAGLGAETIRQTALAREVMTESLQRQIQHLSRNAPGENEADKRRAAIGSWAAMVGAVILARMCQDSKLSNEILEQTRGWIEDKTASQRKQCQ